MKYKHIIVPLFWIYIGILFWSFSEDIATNCSKFTAFIINSLTGGFSVYGFICFLANLKNSKNFENFKSEIIENLSDAFTDKNDGRMD